MPMHFRFILGSLLAVACSIGNATGASCVWRVTGPSGGTLYLGGSWHLLRSRDYPLPGAYNAAFDASSYLAFEVNPKDLDQSGKVMEKAGVYPRGDSLKNHVDPRTYDYLKRFFSLVEVPESKFNRLRPWFLKMALESPEVGGFEYGLGVERYLQRRAQANGKMIVGLETAREHAEVYSGLSDRAGEALLLLTFIPADKNSPDSTRMLKAWRNGDADFLARATHEGFADFPAMGDRLITNRNRNWIPKIEGWLRSGKTYFVVAGAAHMGGPNGVVSLLRQRGYKVEQL
jgi:uncharacterized protein